MIDPVRSSSSYDLVYYILFVSLNCRKFATVSDNVVIPSGRWRTVVVGARESKVPLTCVRDFNEHENWIARYCT